MHHQSHGRKRPSIRRCLFYLGIAALAVAAVFLALSQMEAREHVQARGVSTMHIGERRRIEHQGKTYAEKTGMTTMLLMGVDKTEDSVSYGARRGGQSDFMMVVVIDPNTRTIHRLHIDRDTMAQVDTVGVLGNRTGTQTMQICLAHGFGASDAASCQNALHAVERLLDMDVKLYAAIDMDGIAALNDALGGVTVTLEDDFSHQDPAMVAGTTIKLNGAQAETFVRGRMSVGDGTNASRMVRQQAYMHGATEAFRTRMEQDQGFIAAFLDALDPHMTANMSRSRMMNEANKAYRYDTPPAETLPGEHRIGEDGFMEYHVAEGAALEWLLRTCYELEE